MINLDNLLLVMNFFEKIIVKDLILARIKKISLNLKIENLNIF